MCVTNIIYEFLERSVLEIYLFLMRSFKIVIIYSIIDVLHVHS